MVDILFFIIPRFRNVCLYYYLTELEFDIIRADIVVVYSFFFMNKLSVYNRSDFKVIYCISLTIVFIILKL